MSVVAVFHQQHLCMRIVEGDSELLENLRPNQTTDIRCSRRSALLRRETYHNVVQLGAADLEGLGTSQQRPHRPSDAPTRDAFHACVVLLTQLVRFRERSV